MSEAPGIDRDHEILGDLAERAYALACRVQDQAMAAEEPATLSRLTGDFDRAARCVRQVIGLKARLKHDAVRQDRDERAGAQRQAAGEVATRRARVGAAVRRVIGEQYAGYDARELREDLEGRLDEEALYGDFTEETLEDHIERLCDELGLAKAGEEPPRRGPPLDPYIAELLARIPDEIGDEAPTPPVSPSGGKRREGPQGRLADGGSDHDTPPAEDDPDDTPPIGHSPEPVLGPADGRTRGASGRFPPQAGESDSAAAQPEPEPPPRPPDPEPPEPKPYIPPWERNPAARRRYPGGHWMG
mgnify:CR=1 FL=1